jgi:hypothetical protein
LTKAQADYSADAFRRTGEALAHLGAEMQGYRQWQVHVTGLSVRGPKAQGDEFLVTVRAVDAEGKKWVGFNSAMELHDAITGAIVRVQNDTMRWKEDTWER